MINVNYDGGSCRVESRAVDLERKTRCAKSVTDVWFLATIDSEVDSLQGRRYYGRANSYSSARNSFGRFLAACGLGSEAAKAHSGDVRLSQITATVIGAYEKWLHENGVVRNTVSFYMRILRAVYNRAVRKCGLVVNNPFADVYTGNDRTEKRNVNKFVVQQLINLDLSHSRGLEFARDMFLFSFLTRGMPFVDMAYLRWSDIKGKTLTYCRHKTGQQIKQTIDPQAMRIIEHWHVAGSAMVFPILDTTADEGDIYRQYRSALSLHNKRLRKISAMIGDDVHLTSYVARHTWATMAWECGVPLVEISIVLGHTSERTTRIYLDVWDSPRLDRHCQRVAKKLRFNSTQ